MAEWFRLLDLTSGVPWVQFSNLLLYGFVLGSPEFKLIACVNSQLVSLPHELGYVSFAIFSYTSRVSKVEYLFWFSRNLFLPRGSMLSYI